MVFVSFLCDYCVRDGPILGTELELRVLVSDRVRKPVKLEGGIRFLWIFVGFCVVL